MSIFDQVNELIAFVFASAISLWGSLQLGIVNVSVIYTTLYKGNKSAKLVALGGVLPEIFYSAIAFWAVELLANNEKLYEILQISVVPVLLIMGIVIIFQKPKEYSEPYSYSGSFFRGFVLASVNPQLITFWFAWILVLKGQINMDEGTFISPKLTFVIGTAFGAYLMLRIFIILTEKHKEKVLKWMARLKLNIWVGAIFISIALFILLKYYFFSS